MFQSKFSFIGKIFFLAFFFVNIPSLFPIKILDASYFFVFTTTIFDTATLLVLSLSISKFIHIKNFKFLENLHNKANDNNKFTERINEQISQIKSDNKLTIITTIFFVIITLIQPIILINTLNKSDIYASGVITSINNEFNSQKNRIETMLSREDREELDYKNVRKLEDSILNLARIKDENINQFLKSNNKNKLGNVKIIIRNFLLGMLYIICFYKIFKI